MGFRDHSLHSFSSITLIAALMAGPAFADAIEQPGSPHDTVLGQEITEKPKIQLAILLDTSSSMDGLIDQTRNQLWQIVNEFSTAKKNGVTPVLEIALFEYGNDGLSENSGYVRMLNSFTRELDKVSEGLFSLTTYGGKEFCGYAIKTAINNLQWSHSNKDIKAIFIAGNESFAQGPVHYRDAAKLAVQHNISINTIHAGGHQQGIQLNWQSGALLAGGSYMHIDADQKIVHIVAPQDKKIAQLNTRLNSTYLPYGKKGSNHAQRQMEQDKHSSTISAGLLAKRAKSKSSSFYSNASWDLVDAFQEGAIDAAKLAKIEDAELPDDMKGLSSAEKLAYVHKKAKERTDIKKEINQQSELRDAYVAKAKRDQVAVSPSMSDALTKAIKNQAEQKNFTFEK
jgi:hypothetical protein